MSKFWPLNFTFMIFFYFFFLPLTATSILKKCFHISLSKESEGIFPNATRPNMNFTSQVIPMNYYLLLSISVADFSSPLLKYFFFFIIIIFTKSAASHATLNRIINTQVSLPRRFFIINFSKTRLLRQCPQQTIACP